MSDTIGKVLGCLIVFAVNWLFGPWIVSIAYNIIQSAFGGLPVLTFWEIFFITHAIRILFGHNIQIKNKR